MTVQRACMQAFSPDARWLVSASSDGSLRVWDVPNARCVDWLRTPRAPTSVAFSPTGEFLATSHVGHGECRPAPACPARVQCWPSSAPYLTSVASTACAAAVGLFLWLNRTRYEDVFLDSEPQRPGALRSCLTWSKQPQRPWLTAALRTQFGLACRLPWRQALARTLLATPQRPAGRETRRRGRAWAPLLPRLVLQCGRLLEAIHPTWMARTAAMTRAAAMARCTRTLR